MQSKGIVVKSFADLAKVMQQEDVRKAQNLRKSRALAQGKSTPGPRIAR